jgi:hypothetical protein
MTNRPEFRNQNYPVALVRAVCALAGNPTYIDDLERTLRSRGIVKAVADHDTPKLFEWLVEEMSYQGIANGIAADYMRRHGRATWRAVQAGLAKDPSCPKLGSYWQFHGCRYHKGSRTCAEPEHIETCPLPALALRNGNLNQLAYSLFLFMRDLIGGIWSLGSIRGSRTPIRPPGRFGLPRCGKRSWGRCDRFMGYRTRC